jgi:hypothetical protein
MSMLTTVLSVYSTLSKLFFESNILQENRLEYLLICLKGKHGWIPFNRLLERNLIKKDINFGQLKLKLDKGLNNTDTTGNYFSLSYKFTD